MRLAVPHSASGNRGKVSAKIASARARVFNSPSGVNTPRASWAFCQRRDCSSQTSMAWVAFAQPERSRWLQPVKAWPCFCRWALSASTLSTAAKARLTARSDRPTAQLPSRKV